jgi:hypothetical protein
MSEATTKWLERDITMCAVEKWQGWVAACDITGYCAGGEGEKASDDLVDTQL